MLTLTTQECLLITYRPQPMSHLSKQSDSLPGWLHADGLSVLKLLSVHGALKLGMMMLQPKFRAALGHGVHAFRFTRITFTLKRTKGRLLKLNNALLTQLPQMKEKFHRGVGQSSPWDVSHTGNWWICLSLFFQSLNLSTK